MATQPVDPRQAACLQEGVSVEGFQAGYGASCVLDVSLILPARQVSVLVGPGGSGKTTFVRALENRSCPESLWRAGQVELPEGLHRFQRQSPVSPGRTLASLLVAGDDKRGEALPDEAGRVVSRVWPEGSIRGQLLEQLESPVQDLAPWFHRLAAFTAAIAEPASLFVFDEPDAELPADLLTPLAGRIAGLVPEATVLLVTHNLSLAREVADFVVLMIDGKIIEAAENKVFFHEPRHDRTRDFVRMGC